MVENQKEMMDKLTEEVKDCQISETISERDPGIILGDMKPQLLTKWPVLRCKVPVIFLHKPVNFTQYVHKVLSLGIKFYHPSINKAFIKITCQSFNDHRSLIKFFVKKQLPFHTYGHPTKRKMKVVIKGLPIDTDLLKLQEELKQSSIPIVRVHKMHSNKKDPTNMVVLAVVPYDNNGKKISQVVSIFGHNVQLEPPIAKSQQCHRCQKWGHSQRYCHGSLKCVKCAGDHFSKKCNRDPDKVPPKCANCGGEHTASYHKCPHCPDSAVYKRTQANKHILSSRTPLKGPELVTFENCNHLYKNVKYETAQIKKNK